MRVSVVRAAGPSPVSLRLPTSPAQQLGLFGVRGFHDVEDLGYVTVINVQRVEHVTMDLLPHWRQRGRDGLGEQSIRQTARLIQVIEGYRGAVEPVADHRPSHRLDRKVRAHGPRGTDFQSVHHSHLRADPLSCSNVKPARARPARPASQILRRCACVP